MGFKPYEQNQLQIPMQWEYIIEKEHVSRVVNDVVEQMNLDKILETYSPLGQNSFNPKMMLKILMYGYVKKKYSSRLIAEGVKSDIYFIWLAGGNKPTRNVINDFRKDNMGFKRFLPRGLKKVDIEFGLLSIAFNIKKIHKKEVLKSKEIANEMVKNVNELIKTKIPAISHWNFCFRGSSF